MDLTVQWVQCCRGGQLVHRAPVFVTIISLTECSTNEEVWWLLLDVVDL